MKNTVFDFNDYRIYLKNVLENLTPPRGARSRLAKHLNCQTAFISQVLAGKVDFSLEHAVKIGQFLALSEAENHFLILLIHFGRAGSKMLREHYQGQMNQIREKRSQVEERIEVKSKVSFEDQAHYYSAWYYSTVHVALSLLPIQTPAMLATRLGVPLPRVQEILEFLVKAGMAKRTSKGFTIGHRRIHLGNYSPFIRKHHINWRMKAVNSLDFPSKSDLHYSGVFTLTAEDFSRIREMLLDVIQKSEPIIRESREETLGALCLDWFGI